MKPDERADAPDFAYDVFLSHSSADKPRVRRLAERLKAAGVRVWLDEWAIKAGDIISLKVDEGLIQSRVLLLCISPAALKSGWVALERSTAIHRDPANEGRRFIPLLLGDCALPDTLGKYKYVDFRQESEAAFEEVLTSFRTGMEAKLFTPRQKLNKKPRTKAQKRAKTLAVLERILSRGTEWGISVAISLNGKRVISGSWDKNVQIWNLDTGRFQLELQGHWGTVQSVAITPNGKLILSSSFDRSIRVWDAKSGQPLAKFNGHKEGVYSVVTLFDNKRALSGGLDKTLRLWDIASRSCLKTIKCGIYEAADIFCCAVNQAGIQALSGHRDGGIRLWDLESGSCLANLNAHVNIVKSIQFTPDGCFAVSGSKDATIKIWDLEAKACVGTLEGHQSAVHSVAISPDGTLVASAGFQDYTVRLWDWRSGACLQVVESNDWRKDSNAVISVAFSPDGLRLVVGTYNGPIYVYRITGIRPTRTADATRRYVNAKVVLLGEGAIGKTSLAHRLIEDIYVVKDRTHGMNVMCLDLPFSRNATSEREALLWDLAGQEDYRLIHQLFLDETALALLLINPQKDDPFVEAGDWLKALKTAANSPDGKRDAARLLIFAQIDVGGMKLSNAKIDRFREQHGFVDWLSISAKTGENCSDQENGGQPSKLKKLIAKSIPWDKLPWTSTPRLLAELRKAVMAMREASDIRLLRFSELAQRLEQSLPGEKFAEQDVRTAVTLLANHGLARPLKFGDLVLLRPDVINGYAGAVIRSARAHTDEIGCVREADIYSPDFDFTGVERLKHRPDEELLLRALVQTFLDHSLCIAEETPQGRHLVFPSQYRREKDLPHEPAIFVSYTFSGEWQTVWTTLVVRLWYSQEYEHRELWRNAAEFESARKQTMGLKIEKMGDGAAKISLYFDLKVPDELKVLFIEYVHRHLAKHACEVSRVRCYRCQKCGRPVSDLDAVRERLKAGKTFIRCQTCDCKIILIDLIEQRADADPVARKVQAMDENATRALDTQALEQILIGHMMAITGEANQIFRPMPICDRGIDGVVEFKDDDGMASGKRIYVQLTSKNSYRHIRQGDGGEVFKVSNIQHLKYWMKQPVDVYLVIRQTDDLSGQQVIRWMNVTRYLKARTDKRSRQILFTGEKLDMEAVYRVRDGFFPPPQKRK